MKISSKYYVSIHGDSCHFKLDVYKIVPYEYFSNQVTIAPYWREPREYDSWESLVEALREFCETT